MTPEDIERSRIDAALLAGQLRDIATSGRTALASVREEAERARHSLNDTERATRDLTGSLRSGLSRALRSALLDGARLSDTLRGLALDIARSTANRAISGLSGQIAGALGRGLGAILPFEKGGVIQAGRVRAFARGGVLDGPSLFPLRNGLGLAGEAGPEAILPLRRGPDGRLGVAGGGGTTPTVVVNIQTPDADSFRRSQSQIAATLARAVDRGRRNA